MSPAETVILGGRSLSAQDFPETADAEAWRTPFEPRVIVSDVCGPRGPVVRLTFAGRTVDIIGWHGRTFDGPSALAAGNWYRTHPRATFEAWVRN